MTNKYQNKYRISSARLPTWDYGWQAAYFVTICTANRVDFFGNITNGELQLSTIGKITESEWFKTPQIRPDMKLKLGAFVVMPNHFHGIIIIGNNVYNNRKNNDELIGRDGGRDRDRDRGGDRGGVETRCIASLQQNEFGPQRKNLASIIRGVKSSVTKQVRQFEPDFGWQTRFHDHVIRDEKSYHNIENYINANVINWHNDRFNK